MITPNEKSLIAKTLRDPLVYNDVISSHDLLNFKKAVFAGWNDCRSYKGGKIIFNNFNENTKKFIVSFLKEFFPHSIPTLDMPWDDVKIFGNIYITTSEYGIHTDAFTEEVLKKNKEVNLKNVIIPFDVCGWGLEQPNINNLILMRNRLIDYDKTFQKGSTDEWHVRYQDNVTDYNNLDWVDENGRSMNLDPDKMYITDDEYNTHLTHIKDKKILESFVLDKAVKYTPGSLIVHDTTQVHVTGHMETARSKVTNKAGIRLFLRTPLSSIA